MEAGKHRVIKVSLVYICQMSMIDLDGEKIQATAIPFRSQSFLVHSLKTSSLKRKIVRSFKEQENAMEEFCDSGSNWIFDRAIAYDTEIAAVKPLAIGSSSSYTSDSETDLDDTSYHKFRVNITNMKNKKFLFNPKNDDSKCFLRCVYQQLKSRKNQSIVFSVGNNFKSAKHSFPHYNKSNQNLCEKELASELEN